ncbi:MAG: hypothetical protein ACOX6T_20460 [Myxococcales bacterium]
MKRLFGLCACAALLAACGANIEGEWRGTLADTNGRSADVVLQLTQRGDEVRGTMTTFGLPCLSAATIEGSVDGDALSLTGASGETKIELEGKVNDEETEASGTFEIPTAGACVGAKGQWKATR